MNFEKGKIYMTQSQDQGEKFSGQKKSQINKYAFSFSSTNRTQSIWRNLKKSLNRKTRFKSQNTLRGQKNRSYLIQSCYDFIIIFVVINAASQNSFILKTRTTIRKTFSSFFTTLLQIILISNHFHKAQRQQIDIPYKQPYWSSIKSLLQFPK